MLLWLTVYLVGVFMAYGLAKGSIWNVRRIHCLPFDQKMELFCEVLAVLSWFGFFGIVSAFLISGNEGIRWKLRIINNT